MNTSIMASVADKKKATLLHNGEKRPVTGDKYQ